MCCGLGALACCFGSAACSCCCAACPSCKNSTSSRIVYGLFLLVGAVLAAVFLLPQVEDALKTSPFLCQNTTVAGIKVSDQLLSPTVCEGLVGYRSVYRVCFGVSAFFFLMSLIMINAKTSKDPRAGIQNGFWAFKFLVMVGLIIAAFFIPNGSFETVFMYFGMIGAFIFIIIQLVLLVDFAHSWNENWVGRMEDTENKGWYCMLMSSTVIMYCLALTGTILFYIFYIGSGKECSLHKFFISFTLVLCIVMSVVSVLPKVQDAMPRSGLLQSAVISMYITYLTWSAMSNNPDQTCNPSITEIYQQIKTKNGTATVQDAGTAENWVSFGIWLICILYACLRTASTNNVGKLTGSEKVLLGSTNGDSGPSDGKDAEKWGQEVYDNEEEGVAYSYTFFHIMLMLAAFYIMMTLTSWFQPSGANFDTLAANSGAMWVKIVSCWLCALLYVWTLVAPIMFPGRDFN